MENMLGTLKALMRRVAAAAVVLAFLVAATGCHTVHGAGKDVQSAGRTIERSSGEPS